MQRYFIQTNQLHDHEIIIDGSDVHHIKNVMRMNIGDQILCTDEDHHTYRVQIKAIGAVVHTSILEQIIEQTELSVRITIAQGIISRDKTEEVIKRLSELGVSSYLPVAMKRSKFRLDQAKFERFHKIIKEACEQSQRNTLMILQNPVAFEALETIGSTFDDKFVAHVDTSMFLARVLPPKGIKNILFVIGPEGGFDSQELTQLQSWGYKIVHLGSRVLRTETAPLYIASICGYVYGENDAN
ncbi:MAG: RsmE family RNA methyltransferase [Bacilli bacterium]